VDLEALDRDPRLQDRLLERLEDLPIRDEPIGPPVDPEDIARVLPDDRVILPRLRGLIADEDRSQSGK